jgi:hypothetical protein
MGLEEADEEEILPQRARRGRRRIGNSGFRS